MENPVSETARPSFNPSAAQQSDIKQRFYRYFQEEVTGLYLLLSTVRKQSSNNYLELQDQMSLLESYALIGGERQDAIDHCLAGISRLSNEVTDATGFIPAYDQRTYAQAVKGLTEKLQETRSKFAPKSRFQFKTTNKNGSAISLNDAAELAAEKRLAPNFRPGFKSSAESSLATTPANLATPPGERENTVGDLPSFRKNYNEEMMRPGASGPVRKPSFSQATNVNISGHTGLHIILPSSASRATASGSLTQLNRCIVDMSVPTANGAPFAGLALKNIQSSLIIAGHVAGAAHITAVEDSIIVVASRQVRMHDCKNVEIYLHCASRPIIEDCSNVRFAPIPECYVSTMSRFRDMADLLDRLLMLKSQFRTNGIKLMISSG